MSTILRVPQVTVSHSKIKDSKAEVPVTAVKHLEKAGWKVEEKKELTAAEKELSTPDETGQGDSKKTTDKK